jgi:ADP-L-glycero-D-manno-heptose 6-epimerase
MILVTGHKGFIGRSLCDRLLAEKYEIVGIDALDGDPHELTREIDWSKIEGIFHQGAVSSTLETDVAKIYSLNIDYSIKLFEKAIEHGIPVRYASSASVYGNSKDYSYNPLNYYAMSKLTVDMWVQQNFYRFKAPITGFRYFNVYGLDERKSDCTTSPIYKFTEQAKNDGVIKLFYGSENMYRDFVWVEDVVTVIMSDRYAVKRIFDVGTGEPESFLSVAQMISKKYDVPIKFIPMPDNIKSHYQHYTKAQPHLDKWFEPVNQFLMRC